MVAADNCSKINTSKPFEAGRLRHAFARSAYGFVKGQTSSREISISHYYHKSLSRCQTWNQSTAVCVCWIVITKRKGVSSILIHKQDLKFVENRWTKPSRNISYNALHHTSNGVTSLSSSNNRESSNDRTQSTCCCINPCAHRNANEVIIINKPHKMTHLSHSIYSSNHCISHFGIWAPNNVWLHLRSAISHNEKISFKGQGIHITGTWA